MASVRAGTRLPAVNSVELNHCQRICDRHFAYNDLVTRHDPQALLDHSDVSGVYAVYSHLTTAHHAASLDQLILLQASNARLLGIILTFDALSRLQSHVLQDPAPVCWWLDCACHQPSRSVMMYQGDHL